MGERTPCKREVSERFVLLASDISHECSEMVKDCFRQSK